MNAKMTKDKRERYEANVEYFVSLANSRASLSRLPTMVFVSAIFLGLDQLFVYSAIFDGNYEFQLLFDINIALIVLSFLAFLLSLIKPFVFRFQIAFSVLSTVFAVIMLYSLCLLSWSIATMVEGGGFAMIFSLESYAIFGVVGLLLMGGGIVAHVLLLRKRLSDGHSENRTAANLLAASSVYSSKSLWVIFAIAVIGPNVFTGGRYLTLTVGVLGFLLFASVMTGLPVEFGYLAYLKSRDKRYWERRPPKTVMDREEKISVLKKVTKWVLIVLAVIAVLVLLPVIWP